MRPKPGRRAEAVLGGRAVPYLVTVSPRATRARLRVGPGGVEVVVPPAKSAEFAAEFLKANAAWVLGRLEAAGRTGNLSKQPAVHRTATTLYRGSEAPIAVERRDAARGRPRVTLADGLIRVELAPGADARQAVERWLRRAARAALAAQVLAWQVKLGRRPARLFVRGQRTKWGNCSKLGNVSFNWRLVMAPPAALEAVVVHELAHLVEPSHSRKFWLLVWSHCPEYARHARWLKANEARLFACPDLPP